MTTYRIEKFRSGDLLEQPYFFRLNHGRNVIAQSEGYVNRKDRDKTADRLADALNGGGSKCKLVDLDPPATTEKTKAKTKK